MRASGRRVYQAFGVNILDNIFILTPSIVVRGTVVEATAF